MRCWSIFAFYKLMLLNSFSFTYFCFFLQTANDKCWFVSLVRRDHAKNQVGMVSFLSSMNGFFLPRNLMACGKGLFDNFVLFILAFVDVETWCFLVQLNLWAGSQAKVVAVCGKRFALYWERCQSFPCIMEPVRNLLVDNESSVFNLVFESGRLYMGLNLLPHSSHWV